MDNIDNFLNSLGYDTSESSSPTEVTETETFSEEDISDILQDNGFTESPVYDENQGEGNDDIYWDDGDVEDEEDDNEEEVDETSTESSEAEDTPIDDTPSEVEESSPSEEPSLPLNSPTLLIDESTTRFSGTEWFSKIQQAHIILAGVGGIGSNVAFQLARMVPENITLYDEDVVDVVNMAGQLYKRSDVGKFKVDAISDMITAYTTARQIYALRQKFSENSEPGDIMICGFDNMKARKTFFNAWLHHLDSKSVEYRKHCLFIDGRLSIDTLQIFCIQGDDVFNICRYNRDYLFSDAEADATICSMKQTTYMACMIGSLIVNLFTNFIANTLNPIIPYDLPFFTEYDAQNMIFKTEN